MISFCGIGCSHTRRAKKGNDSMNAMELNFMPGARGLYALALRAPGAYKAALAGRHVVWRSGRAF